MPRHTKLYGDWPWGGQKEAGLAAGMGWGEPCACECPAPGQWTVRTAPPILLWRDRIRLGPGGYPLLLLPTGFLFVPESWSNLPIVLFVMYRQENQRELGELPHCLAPRERSDLGAKCENGWTILRVPWFGLQAKIDTWVLLTQGFHAGVLASP